MIAYGWTVVLVAVGVVACGGASDPAGEGGGTTSTSVETGGSGGGSVCGDGVCSADEGTLYCPQDCHCGNGWCDAGETFASCPQDGCTCGDGVCDERETYESCAVDGCTCGDGACDAGETVSCDFDCVCGTPEQPVTPCGDLVCDAKTEFCVYVHGGCAGTTFTCRRIPANCEGTATCGCVIAGFPEDFPCRDYNCSEAEWGCPTVLDCADVCGS